jgi:hypothetical protein
MRRRLVVVILGGAIGLLIVYARLLSHHYYRVTYAVCEEGSTSHLCSLWQQQAMVEAAIVLGLAAICWLYLSRASGRSPR